MLDGMTRGFEGRHRFPPGTNQVRLANDDDQEGARALARHALAASDLVTFYRSVGDVVWEDIGNGYFIHPVRDILEHLMEYGAVRVGEGQEPSGLVIGSDGSGRSYVMGPQGAIHRTRSASLEEPELDQVADDLRHFLELLEQSLARFVATGDPGPL
ncbi:SMI1/KNR4 family protein [Streptomyces sp. NPDC026294]|uniref:SMI1/KNR4 family protein n=1 Tax=Streptomyces sp. NPDC026294 TaxID=3155362 RepID=UPI003407287E